MAGTWICQHGLLHLRRLRTAGGVPAQYRHNLKIPGRGDLKVSVFQTTATETRLPPPPRDSRPSRLIRARLPRLTLLCCSSCRDSSVPCFVSSLLQCPLLAAFYSGDEEFLVLTANGESLRPSFNKMLTMAHVTDPERQARFDALAREHGSKFVWHGSRKENWHAILRNGLRNASGTKLQLNGAAHGQGIYLSSSAQMSAGYSQMGMYGAGGPQVRPQDRDRAAPKHAEHGD